MYMIIKKYPAPPIETAAERYDRDWLNVPDLDTAGNDDYRHDRTLLQQSTERKSRRYVDDGISAVTGGSPVFDPSDPGDSTPIDPGDNGGGTPEPEPEIPTEPEFPEGSYQENYTETY